MVTVLVVYKKAEPRRGGEVVEYLPIEDGRYPTLDGFLEAVGREYDRLYEKYGMPNDDVDLFEGSASDTVDGFFEYFAEFRLTASAIRSEPQGA